GMTKYKIVCIFIAANDSDFAYFAITKRMQSYEQSKRSARHPGTDHHSGAGSDYHCLSPAGYIGGRFSYRYCNSGIIGIIELNCKAQLTFFTIPITVFHLGLFIMVINAVIVLIAAEIVPGFVVDGFWWALLFSLILSLINSLLGVSLKG